MRFPHGMPMVRLNFAWALCAALLPGAALAAGSPDTRFANYAFASELGSGVYELGGRTIQVYQLQPAYRRREAAAPRTRPGLHIVFPLTVGFFNFKPQDLVHLQVPTRIGALSLEPGAQLDYWLRDHWHVYPYLKGGATFASASAADALIYGVGVRSDVRFAVGNDAALWRAELAHAGVHFHSALPNDHFTRLRDGVEVRQPFGAAWRERQPQLGLYALVDVYADAPSGPNSGISARTVQFEGGLLLGVNPMWTVYGIPVPRLGVGYRAAGVLSGWRLVIGEPF
ncbi:MAG: hypothetical protein JO341_02175 [Gammaproteobacteria bacterium]|nr:hypothetical protein [Gammaproteobacteria bacterium]